MRNELTHHGIQGQKWGVRRYQNEDGSLTSAGYSRYGVNRVNEALNMRAQNVRNVFKYGIRKGHAKNVSNRINRYVMNDERKARMTASQRLSAKKAQEYWNARAEGITPASKRGLVRRVADSYRSYSAGERAVSNIITNMSSTLLSAAAMERAGIEVDRGRSAINSVVNTAGGLAIDELLNKILGHF